MYQTETPAQQYTRLVSEQGTDPTARQQLRELLAVPPAGYSLPVDAAALVADAEAAGWVTLVQWTPPTHQGEPSVIVQVRRELAGGGWKFQQSWHAEAGLGWRLGSGMAKTPGSPADHDAPSVEAMRAVIAAPPAATA